MGITGFTVIYGGTVKSLKETPASRETRPPCPCPSIRMQLTDLELTVSGVAAGTSLADKVDVAQSYVASGDTAGACETLRAFVNDVRALSGRRMSRGQALGLITTAERIQTVIGC